MFDLQVFWFYHHLCAESTMRHFWQSQSLTTGVRHEHNKLARTRANRSKTSVLLQLIDQNVRGKSCKLIKPIAFIKPIHFIDVFDVFADLNFNSSLSLFIKSETVVISLRSPLKLTAFATFCIVCSCFQRWLQFICQNSRQIRQRFAFLDSNNNCLVQSIIYSIKLQRQTFQRRITALQRHLGFQRCYWTLVYWDDPFKWLILRLLN